VRLNAAAIGSGEQGASERRLESESVKQNERCKREQENRKGGLRLSFQDKLMR
jgi:hypothetical protein